MNKKIVIILLAVLVVLVLPFWIDYKSKFDYQSEIVYNKALEIVENETDFDQKVREIYYWVYNNIDNDMERWSSKRDGEWNCSRIGFGNYFWPSYILQTRCGKCEEYAILSASLLNSIGIKTMVKYCPGHAYNEVYNGTGWSLLDTTLNPDETNGYDNHKQIITHLVSRDCPEVI